LLRINAPVSFGILHLAPLWGAFASAHPKVALEVSLADRIVDLVEEGYDLAVRVSRLSSSTLVSRRLATTRLVLCASPEYLKEHGRPVHPEELTKHAVISYSYFSGRDEWEFRSKGGTVKVRLNPRIHTNNGDTCRAAALAHQGIIMQPSFLVGPDIQAGVLEELLPGYLPPELGVYAVYASRKQQPLKLRRMIEFLVEAFKTPRWPQL
jgi:DNA-binding transcriptional LysR family regulator